MLTHVETAYGLIEVNRTIRADIGVLEIGHIIIHMKVEVVAAVIGPDNMKN